MIPVLAALAQFLSVKLMPQATNQSSGNETADSMMQSMKMMNYFMPIMMGVMTINLPAGLGVYWAVSNLFQALQTVIINKTLRKKDAKLGEERK